MDYEKIERLARAARDAQSEADRLSDSAHEAGLLAYEAETKLLAELGLRDQQRMAGFGVLGGACNAQPAVTNGHDKEAI
ncbi:MAG: hypothetical protein CML03_00375 [Pseudooceanicola sp.]|jgi:hypothetical protein|nr:hypothetical protein [Pseudooceanicola sp.]|tara:strand:- start:174 stop:410 length:237 start_codon:yes stop_codon:yes gene_type:complete